MAEMQEVFDDFGKNSKKLLKSKPFKLALLGVAGVALFMAWKNSGEEEDEVDGYVVADGYAGYPETGGGGGGYDDGMTETGMSDEEIVGLIESANSQLAADMNSAMGSYFGDMSSQISDVYGVSYETNENVVYYGEEMLEAQDYNTMLLESMMLQNGLQQMQANSNLYNNISDYQTKQALHQENLAIAEELGLSFDDETGNYTDASGDVAYYTAKQENTGGSILSSISNFISGFFAPGPSNAPNSLNYAGGDNGSLFSAASTKNTKSSTTRTSVTPQYTNNKTYQKNYNDNVSRTYSNNSAKNKTFDFSDWFSGVSNAPSSINRSSGSSRSSGSTKKTTTKKTGGATSITGTTTTVANGKTTTVTSFSNGGTKTYSGGSRNSGGTVQKTKYTATQRAQQERNAVDWEG